MILIHTYHKNPHHTLPLPPLVLIPIKCALLATSMTMTAVREFYHFPLLSIKCAMAVTASHDVQYNTMVLMTLDNPGIKITLPRQRSYPETIDSYKYIPGTEQINIH